jgi:hypothetical protein
MVENCSSYYHAYKRTCTFVHRHILCSVSIGGAHGRTTTFSYQAGWKCRILELLQPRELKRWFERLRTDVIAVLGLRPSSDRSLSKIVLHTTFVDFSMDIM